MKKEKTTPEKAAKRLKAILVAGTLMCGFIILTRILQPAPQSPAPTGVEAVMDRQLDSLVERLFPGAQVTGRSLIEQLDDAERGRGHFRNVQLRLQRDTLANIIQMTGEDLRESRIISAVKTSRPLSKNIENELERNAEKYNIEENPTEQ